MTDDFFGKSIRGDITHYAEKQVEQHDPVEFISLLDTLITLDHVEAVRWYQYTPYFNDGDPCIFGTGELEIKLDVTDPDDEEGEHEDGYLSSYYLYQYGDGSSWQEREQNRIFTYKDTDTKAIYFALQELENAMPHHKVVLQHKFGDPAQVIYDGEAFNVEFYDHD